jgi:hypothetical protein
MRWNALHQLATLAVTTKSNTPATVTSLNCGLPSKDVTEFAEKS